MQTYCDQHRKRREFHRKWGQIEAGNGGELSRRWRSPETEEIGRKWGQIGAENGMRWRSGLVCAGTAGLCWVRETGRDCESAPEKRGSSAINGGKSELQKRRRLAGKWGQIECHKTWR
jgi:hypothetical protein